MSLCEETTGDMSRANWAGQDKMSVVCYGDDGLRNCDPLAFSCFPSALFTHQLLFCVSSLQTQPRTGRQSEENVYARRTPAPGVSG